MESDGGNADYLCTQIVLGSVTIEDLKARTLMFQTFRDLLRKTYLVVPRRLGAAENIRGSECKSSVESKWSSAANSGREYFEASRRVVWCPCHASPCLDDRI